jgi:hypothetical protein
MSTYRSHVSNIGEFLHDAFLGGKFNSSAGWYSYVEYALDLEIL